MINIGGQYGDHIGDYMLLIYGNFHVCSVSAGHKQKVHVQTAYKLRSISGSEYQVLSKREDRLIHASLKQIKDIYMSLEEMHLIMEIMVRILLRNYT